MSKTALEHFQDIKELEVADEQGLTVENLLPYKCKQVEKSLKALEIIKKKSRRNYNLALVDDSQNYKVYCEQFDYFINKWLKEAGAFEVREEDKLTEEEFNILKEVLE